MNEAREGVTMTKLAINNTAKKETSLDDLATLPRWVAWREEMITAKDGTERPTKIPYDPHRRSSRARIPTDASTWGTRKQAERCWEGLRENDDDAIGGVGIVLGVLDDGSLLMGIDLDRCFDDDDQLATWAVKVIERFATYSEVSPSGKGIKLLFRVARSDRRAVEKLLGTNTEGKPKARKTFSAGEHREIAIDRARFYAVTDKAFNDAPKTLRVIAVEDVRWFIEEAGPHYQELHGAGAGDGKRQDRARDESGSGYGYRFMGECKREGLDYVAARKVIRADNGPAGEWAKRVDERQLQRAYENAPASEPIHSWDDPDISLLDDRRGTLPVFPIAAFAPDELQQWVRQAADNTATSIDHVAIPLLGVASGLIGISRRARASTAFLQPLTCWAALVAYSGEGKSPAIGVVRDALAMLELEREPEVAELRREHERRAKMAKAAKKKWEAEADKAVKHSKDVPRLTANADDPGPFIEPHLFVSDVTVESMGQLLQARPHGMLMVMDELAAWFGSMNRYSSGAGVGSDNAFWLAAWDGGPYPTTRKTALSANIKRLLVGVVGGLQPDKIHQVFKGVADGMYARFLFAWPAPPSYRELPEGRCDDALVMKVLDKLDRLRDESMSLRETYLPLSAKAKAAFEQFRCEVFRARTPLEGRERECAAPRRNAGAFALGRDRCRSATRDQGTVRRPGGRLGVGLFLAACACLPASDRAEPEPCRCAARIAVDRRDKNAARFARGGPPQSAGADQGRGCDAGYPEHTGQGRMAAAGRTKEWRAWTPVSALGGQ
jgi:hypothetical protein